MKNAVIAKLAACLIACLLLTGCAGNCGEDGGVFLLLEIETGGMIPGIHYAWSAEGSLQGNGGIVNADGSRMEPGDRVRIQFLPEDFPEGEIPEVFTVRIFVPDNRGQAIEAGELTVFREDREEVRFRLEGSEPEGYCLSRIR